MARHVLVTVDGSSKWRKGSCGWVVRYEGEGVITARGVRQLGQKTNNEAEYAAVIEGCRVAEEYRRSPEDTVTIFSDSQLVVRQLSGMYAVRKKELRRWHKKANNALRAVKARLVWHRRDEGDGPLADLAADGRFDDGDQPEVEPAGPGAEAPGGAEGAGLPSGTV
jgi:ribonuclease HI